MGRFNLLTSFYYYYFYSISFFAQGILITNFCSGTRIWNSSEKPLSWKQDHSHKENGFQVVMKRGNEWPRTRGRLSIPERWSDHIEVYDVILCCFEILFCFLAKVCWVIFVFPGVVCIDFYTKISFSHILLCSTLPYLPLLCIILC